MLIQFISKYKLTPHRLFLMDGIGAMVSTFFLGVILVQVNQLIGLTKNNLYILASIPAVFAIYSLVNFYLQNKNSNILIGIIGFLNLSYCAFTAYLIIKHLESITIIGLLYFTIEFSIVIFIGIIELKVAFNKA